MGRALAEVYWKPGNSRGFLDLVKEMTGVPFSADALVEKVSGATEDAVVKARALYEAGAGYPAPGGDVDLDLRLSVIHGKEVVVEETRDPLAVASRFREWILENWPKEAAGAGA